MAVLIIGATERERIAEMIAYANAHALTFDKMREAIVSDRPLLKLEDRKPGFERPPSQHVVLPGGYRCAFSVEQQPAGFCSHLSISVEGRSRKGMMPSLEAVQTIAQEFGVPFPPDKGWTEEFDPGEYAINLLSLYAPAKEDNEIRDLLLRGFEEVTEQGGRLWELHRGCRFDCIILESKITSDGRRLFIRVGKR
jgi:hypothetical protein